MTLSRRDRLWMASMKLCRKWSGCHQMPERSFFMGDYQLPLCARCTGIILGHAAGLIISFFCRVPGWSIIAAVPLMIDGAVQECTDYESTNPRRLVTRVMYGFGMMSALICLVRRLSGFGQSV